MVGRPPRGSADGRKRLVDATLGLLLELKAGERLTIAAVCAAAGCTPPTLYHHFGSLDALEKEVSRDALRKFSEEVLTGYNSIDDVEQRTVRLGRDYLDWAIANPHLFHVIFGRPGADTFPASLDDLEEVPVLKQLLHDIAYLCDLPVDDPQVVQLAVSHWAVAQGIATLAISSPNFTPELQNSTLKQITEALVDPIADARRTGRGPRRAMD